MANPDLVAADVRRLILISGKEATARSQHDKDRGALAVPVFSQSLTSAATIETCLHAVERIPPAGRGQPARFVPIRFIYRNKLTQDDKLLLTFDAFVFSEMLDRAVSLDKIICGDALVVTNKIAEFTNPVIYGKMQIG